MAAVELPVCYPIIIVEQHPGGSRNCLKDIIILLLISALNLAPSVPYFNRGRQHFFQAAVHLERKTRHGLIYILTWSEEFVMKFYHDIDLHRGQRSMCQYLR